MRTLYIFWCRLRLVGFEKEMCVVRGSLAICPYQGSPLSLAFLSAPRDDVQSQWGKMIALQCFACSWVPNFTDWKSTRYSFRFFCRKKYSHACSELELSEPSVQVCKGLLGAVQAEGDEPSSCPAQRYLPPPQWKQGKGWKQQMSPFSFSAQQQLVQCPWLCHKQTLLLHWTNRMQPVPYKHKGIRANSSQLGTPAAAPVAHSLPVNSRNAMKLRTRPRKQITAEGRG